MKATEEQKARMRAAYRRRWANPEYRAKYNARVAEIAKLPWRKKQLHEAYKKRYSKSEYRKRVLSKNLEWNKLHPDYNRKSALTWRNQNIEKARASERRWRKSDAGKVWTQIRDHSRRAAKLQVTHNPKSIEIFIKGTREKKSVTCYYCDKGLPGKSVHFDHVIPLSKGGPHSVENLCVSCPNCNQSKLNKPIQEWMRLGQQILSL